MNAILPIIPGKGKVNFDESYIDSQNLENWKMSMESSILGRKNPKKIKKSQLSSTFEKLVYKVLTLSGSRLFRYNELKYILIKIKIMK